MAVMQQASVGVQIVGDVIFCTVVVLLLLWLGRWFFYMVRWAKRRSTGAYLMLAFLPLISLLPIPPTEIKKIQQIKQQQIKQKDEALLEQSNTISKTVKELDITKEKLENTLLVKNNLDNEIKQLTTSLDNFKDLNEIKIKQIEKFYDLFFSDINKPFFVSIDKFPPEIINKVNELKNENKWKTFLSVGNFFENGGSMGGQALTSMIDKEIAFERGSREDFTPIGRIIWKYRNVFENYEAY